MKSAIERLKEYFEGYATQRVDVEVSFVLQKINEYSQPESTERKVICDMGCDCVDDEICGICYKGKGWVVKDGQLQKA